MFVVILFTVAKALVELRAIYAHLFKGPSSRVSGFYHAAVFGFFIGGCLFGTYLCSLVDADMLIRACTSLGSSVCFLLGSVTFVVDACPHFRKDAFGSTPSNVYLLGSLLFLFGSLCWIVGSTLLFPRVAAEAPENEPLIHVFNFLAGVLYLFGSSCFLILGYFEMTEFNRGPDLDLPAVRRRCEKLGVDPDPSNNPHFSQRKIHETKQW